MKKGNFFRGYVLALLAVSVLWIGCPQSADGPAPAVPSNVQAERLPDNKLQVTWGLVAGATRYEVANVEGSPQQNAAPPVILSGIGENYSVKVRAGNAEDVWSDWSAPATGGYYSVAGVPVKPVSLTVEAAYEVGKPGENDNEIIQQWYEQGRGDKNLDLLSGVVVASWGVTEGVSKYDIYYIKHAAAEFDGIGNLLTPVSNEPPDTAVKELDSSKRACFVRDVAAGGGVTFWVRGKNDYGDGPMSVVTRQLNANKVLQSGVGGPSGGIERADYPKNVKVRVTGEGEITLSWDKSDRAAWYEVYYYPVAIPLKSSSKGAGSYSAVNGFDLTSAGGYINDGTNTSWYSAVPYLGWFNPPSNDTLQDVATPWNDTDGEAGEVGKVYKIHSLETVITGLNPNRGYYFWIRGPNHNGERGIARTDRIVINNPVPPVVVPSPVIQQVESGPESLNVSWSEIPGASGYRVYYSQYPTPLLSLPSSAVSMDFDTFDVPTSIALVGLEPNTKYYVWVVTQYDNRTSDFSEAAMGVPNVPEPEGGDE